MPIFFNLINLFQAAKAWRWGIKEAMILRQFIGKIPFVCQIALDFFYIFTTQIIIKNKNLWNSSRP